MDVVYRLFDAADRLLYVGISNQIGLRLAQHEKDKSWWDNTARITVQRCPDRTTALAIETDAIRNENPLHNVAGRSTPEATREARSRQQPRRVLPIGERPWLNLNETSQIFRLHPRTIARMIDAGEIPAHVMTRFGRPVRINRVELERFIAERDAAA